MRIGGEKHEQGVAVVVQDFKAVPFDCAQGPALPCLFLPFGFAQGPLFLKRILGQTEGNGLLADAVGVALAASLRAFADAARGPKFRSLDQFFRTSPVNPAPAVVTMAIIRPG